MDTALVLFSRNGGALCKFLNEQAATFVWVIYSRNALKIYENHVHQFSHINEGSINITSKGAILLKSCFKALPFLIGI